MEICLNNLDNQSKSPPAIISSSSSSAGGGFLTSSFLVSFLSSFFGYSLATGPEPAALGAPIPLTPWAISS